MRVAWLSCSLSPPAHSTAEDAAAAHHSGAARLHTTSTSLQTPLNRVAVRLRGCRRYCERPLRPAEQGPLRS
ncbi:hypothetical protein MHYP_G00209050 [Metynnis hypsauchen]